MSEHPLREYRKQRGLSLDLLAQRVGSTKSWLSRIEAGKERPSMALVEKLKAQTGLSADCFLFEALSSPSNARQGEEVAS